MINQLHCIALWCWVCIKLSLLLFFLFFSLQFCTGNQFSVLEFAITWYHCDGMCFFHKHKRLSYSQTSLWFILTLISWIVYLLICNALHVQQNINKLHSALFSSYYAFHSFCFCCFFLLICFCSAMYVNLIYCEQSRFGSIVLPLYDRTHSLTK